MTTMTMTTDDGRHVTTSSAALVAATAQGWLAPCGPDVLETLSTVKGAFLEGDFTEAEAAATSLGLHLECRDTD